MWWAVTGVACSDYQIIGRSDADEGEYSETWSVEDDGSDGEMFEVEQRMADAPLRKHPEDGRPVRRVILAPNLALQHSTAGDKRKLGDKNLERLGFTTYRNAGGGHFERRSGSAGPDHLDAND